MVVMVVMTVKVHNLSAVILALIVGTILGEFIDLEAKIKKLAEILKGGIEKVVPAPNSSMQQNNYMQTFVSILILFCVSGTGIFGSMSDDGMIKKDIKGKSEWERKGLDVGSKVTGCRGEE